MLASYEDLVAGGMGRLGYTEDVARAADVNALAAGLWDFEDARYRLLVAIFGPADAPSLRRAVSAPLSSTPLTPELFDGLFSHPKRSSG